MLKPQNTVLNTCTRVQAFLDANDSVLGAINQSEFRRVLDDVVTMIDSHGTSLESARREGSAQTVTGRVLRNALRVNHLRPIARVAAAMLSNVPEFTALQMPSGKCRSRVLIDTARAMGESAAVNADAFIAAGLPSDFLTRLKAATDALAASLVASGAIAMQRAGATAGLAQQTTRARKAVKVLDSLVEPQLAGYGALLSQWKAAKRIEGRTEPVSDVSVDAAARGPQPTPSLGGNLALVSGASARASRRRSWNPFRRVTVAAAVQQATPPAEATPAPTLALVSDAGGAAEQPVPLQAVA